MAPQAKEVINADGKCIAESPGWMLKSCPDTFLLSSSSGSRDVSYTTASILQGPSDGEIAVAFHKAANFATMSYR